MKGRHRSKPQVDQAKDNADGAYLAAILGATRTQSLPRIEGLRVARPGGAN